TASLSYRGTPGAEGGLTSAQTIKTGSRIVQVDDFARALRGTHANDLTRADDDVCILMTFATPTGTNARVVHAPPTRAVTECRESPKTLAFERWEYDGMKPTNSDPMVRVSNGFVTSRIVSRIDIDTFASLGDIRNFNATYDAVGNPLTVTK